MTEQIIPILALAGRVDTRQDSAWRESAACLGADTELFLPVGATGPAAADIRAAKALCGQRRSVHLRQRRYARMRSADSGSRP